MAIPTYVGNGTVQGSAATITVPWPAGHASGDIGLLCIENYNSTVTLGTPAGFAALDELGSATVVIRKTAVWWCRATSGSQASPVVSFVTNHQAAFIIAFRGCIGTGNPWELSATSTKDTTSTSASCPSVTPTINDSMIVNVCGGTSDSLVANVSASSNGNLSGFTFAVEHNISNNAGGHLSAYYGGLATAGSSGNTSVTWARTQQDAYVTIALKSADPSGGGGGGTILGGRTSLLGVGR